MPMPGDSPSTLDEVPVQRAQNSNVLNLFGYRPISADSHIVEPPGCYRDHIDPKYRDIAPHVEKNPAGGDIFIVDRMSMKIPMGAMASAGVDVAVVDIGRSTYADIHRGGFDGGARVRDQDRDGLAGEIVYPSVGMLICGHPDPGYKTACFDAYNRWLQGFQDAAPDRLFGIGQTAARTVKDTIRDFEKIREMGFYGVMMPCDPGTEFDYDDPSWDPAWQAAVDLKLPLSFHILTSSRGVASIDPDNPTPSEFRGTSKHNRTQGLIRANQDIIGMFIWGGIFERFPDLRLVCAEADAGWAPHYAYRMDHFYHQPRAKKEGIPARPPSEYFHENVYMTFQDDLVAFKLTDMMNPGRLMWASDFPHPDSTWPNSQDLLLKHTGTLTDETRRRILRDNVSSLYGLPVGRS
ncbi:MAG: amidohydrolase family protein [Alphaproteobacteria bacterium]